MHWKKNTLSPRGISLLLGKKEKKKQYSVCVYEAVASLGPPSKQTGNEITSVFLPMGRSFRGACRNGDLKSTKIVFAGYLF